MRNATRFSLYPIQDLLPPPATSPLSPNQKATAGTGPGELGHSVGCSSVAHPLRNHSSLPNVNLLRTTCISPTVSYRLYNPTYTLRPTRERLSPTIWAIQLTQTHTTSGSVSLIYPHFSVTHFNITNVMLSCHVDCTEPITTSRAVTSQRLQP